MTVAKRVVALKMGLVSFQDISDLDQKPRMFQGQGRKCMRADSVDLYCLEIRKETTSTGGKETTVERTTIECDKKALGGTAGHAFTASVQVYPGWIQSHNPLAVHVQSGP